MGNFLSDCSLAGEWKFAARMQRGTRSYIGFRIAAWDKLVGYADVQLVNWCKFMDNTL